MVEVFHHLTDRAGFLEAVRRQLFVVRKTEFFALVLEAPDAAG